MDFSLVMGDTGKFETVQYRYRILKNPDTFQYNTLIGIYN